jgi:hypothetical protein
MLSGIQRGGHFFLLKFRPVGTSALDGPTFDVHKQNLGSGPEATRDLGLGVRVRVLGLGLWLVLVLVLVLVLGLG